MKGKGWASLFVVFIVAAFTLAAAAPGQCAPPKKWDRSADVVIVGAGGAGLAAAVTAAEKKASVIVLEKMPTVGGNTIISGGGLNAADPERQGRQGIQDSNEKHFQQTIAAGDFRADPEKVKILTSQGLDAVHWLESYGMKFNDNVIQIYGSLYPRTHMPIEAKGLGYIKTLKAAADKLGVKTFTETKVEEIIREKQLDGRVLGVRATDKAGKTVYVQAKKAVVLASGGFGANKVLRGWHDPRMRDLTTTNGPQATGEVILQAMDIGGYPIGMDHIQCNPGAPPGRTLRVILHIDVSRYIMVDKKGKRFVAEDERRDVIRDAILNLPEHYGFSVVDIDGYNIHDEIARKTVDKGLETGDAFKADTLEDLAKKMGRSSRRLRRDGEEVQRLRRRPERRRLRQEEAQPQEDREGAVLLLPGGHGGPPHHGRAEHQHQRAGARPPGERHPGSLCGRRGHRRNPRREPRRRQRDPGHHGVRADRRRRRGGREVVHGPDRFSLTGVSRMSEEGGRETIPSSFPRRPLNQRFGRFFPQ